MSRILFVMLHPGFVRYYDQALDALVAAGHDVHVAFEVNRTKLGEDVTAQRLAERSPRLTCGPTPERPESVRDFLARTDRNATRSGARSTPSWSPEGRDEAWESLATTVRLLVDYLRFFEPVFARAGALRARAEKRVPQVYRRSIRRLACLGGPVRRAIAAVCAAVEQTIPPSRAIDAFLRQHDPDLLLVTPLVELGSQQVDYIKAARQLGIRSALGVASWDNLTSKGLMRVVPDHVLVWNDTQKREAVELHGAAPAQVLVTGAHLFDRWFDAQPSRSREAFCRLVGLDPSRPCVLYVGSSVFIAPDEVPFAERWVAAVRASADPAVARLGLLIRPHPANARQWRAFDTDAFENVAIWPPIGTDPNAPDFRRDYVDSMYHSAGVVGINTSAQIEAGIVGRPVFTVRAPEFTHAQDGTLHFQYLVGESGGLVRTAATLDEHVAQLAALVRGAAEEGTARAFVRAFVRPLGLEAPAAPVFARAVEALARQPRPRPQGAGWLIGLRPAAFVLARMSRALAEDRPLWVYAMRPCVNVAVWSWAGAYRTREAWRRGVVSRTRRAARRAYRAGYEGARQLRTRLRRANKRLTQRPANLVRAAVRRLQRSG